MPQVNGVVRTLRTTIDQLESWGHQVLCINPGMFKTIPLPSYPDIRLAVLPYRGVRQRLEAFQPQAIHLSTEGPIGWSGRRYCRENHLPFTTAYHTRFPEYLRLRAPVPLSLSYAYMRLFHGEAAGIMCATESMSKTLNERGFFKLRRWSRGVDLQRFRPRLESTYDLPRPIHLHLGRVAVEKNINAFLDLEMPGSKVIIGDGPARKALQARHPDAHFLGYLGGDALSRHLAGADVLVFPSRTDTFGLVMLEAMACGVPVAAYPVEGPLDLVINGINGWLEDDLQTAVQSALSVERASCRQFAEGFSWQACSQQFLTNLEPFARHAALPGNGTLQHAGE